MTLPGETEAGSAGKQPRPGITRWKLIEDDHRRTASIRRPPLSHIGFDRFPYALKIPARRAVFLSLTKTGLCPFPAEPTHAQVLARTLPRLIDNEEEHERVLADIEGLMNRGGRRSPEEDAALNLLIHLVQAYEEEHYPLEKRSPQRMLKYLMDQRKLKQADLVPIFKSRGYVSDVIHGKREISKAHAKRLATFFKVTPDLFI